MPKRIFATPEEERAYKEQIKAYNKAYKQRPEYLAYITTFKSSEEYKQRQRDYQHERWRSEEFQKVKKSKRFKKKQKKYQEKFYSDPTNKANRLKYLNEYIDRPGIRERKNFLKRKRRRLGPLTKTGFTKSEIDHAVQAIKLKRFARKQRIKEAVRFLQNRKKIYSKVGYMVRVNSAAREARVAILAAA